jgi:hypothetical protein
MANATRITVAAFGALAALAGLEHGIGEILQGNKPPEGLMIQSWPDSAFFEILGGEPAMTLVPNLLLSGILAVLMSLILGTWATLFVHRKHGGQILILLSVLLLLVGGGFGPPLLGIILGAAATRIDAPPAPGRRPGGMGRVLGNLWPWSLAAGLVAWLLLCPGSLLLDHFFAPGNLEIAIVAFILNDLCLYRIEVDGQVDEAELNARSPLRITVEPAGAAATLLAAHTDQSGLVGLLRHLHSRGLLLLSVSRQEHKG